jgi:hypothetical protein
MGYGQLSYNPYDFIYDGAVMTIKNTGSTVLEIEDKK